MCLKQPFTTIWLNGVSLNSFLPKSGWSCQCGRFRRYYLDDLEPVYSEMTTDELVSVCKRIDESLGIAIPEVSEEASKKLIMSVYKNHVLDAKAAAC